MIRPENIRLLDGEPATNDMNVFHMIVEGSVNYGDSVLIMGDVQGLPIRMRAPGVSAGAIDTGSQLRIGWRKEDMHLIPKV